MNNNMIISLDNMTSLCNIIQDSLDNNEVVKANEAVVEMQKEVLAMAYTVQAIRNHIKIAGRNLTDALEKVIELPKEDINEQETIA